MKKMIVLSVVVCACLLGLTACGQSQMNTAGVNEDNYINIDYGVYGDGYDDAGKIDAAAAGGSEITGNDKNKLINALKTCDINEESELPSEAVRSTIDLYGSGGESVGTIIKYEYSDKIYLKDANGLSTLSGEEIREQTDRIMDSE